MPAPRAAVRVAGMALLFFAAAAAADEAPPFSLVLLDDAMSQANEAFCLDGSPGAFYIKPASTSKPGADAAAGFATSWQFYLEGGGWCWSADDCASRAQGGLGSSNNYAPTLGAMGGGIVSSDCSVNPTWCNANQVFFKYHPR